MTPEQFMHALANFVAEAEDAGISYRNGSR